MFPRCWKNPSRNKACNVLTGHKTIGTKVNADSVEITVEPAKGGAPQVLKADVCLVAIGVQPVLPGGAEKLKLTERGYIQVNDRYETSMRGVFAAGDIIGPPWLAHVASFEAIQAVDGHLQKRPCAEEGHACSRAAPTATRKWPASA